MDHSLEQKNKLLKKSKSYIKTLCLDIPERCVGSNGNLAATDFFEKKLLSFKWKAQSYEFKATDWSDGGAELTVDGTRFNVLVSPYSLGCSTKAKVLGANCISDLENNDYKEKIILLYGYIAKEQIMPKNFVFYNTKEHKKIVKLLENSGAKAIICATGRNSALAGGVYPFPLIEDGDFDVPSVYTAEEEGKRLLQFIGKQAKIKSISNRIPSKGYNIIGQKGDSSDKRIVITAHIDAKKGTPGAMDNGTGVTILLLLAELLKDFKGKTQLELVALNGEDYYSVPGQMNYIEVNQGKFEEIMLNINIDGAGYKEGKSAISFFNISNDMKSKALRIMDNYSEITEGKQWVQGDHGLFIQNGVPAIAVTSQWFIENMDNQNITHTSEDNPEIINFYRIVELTELISELVYSY